MSKRDLAAAESDPNTILKGGSQMENQCSRVWPYALTIMIAGALLVLSPITGWAMHLGATHTNVPENVRTTLHNLGSSSANQGTNIDASGGTTEVCVFCHTPHGASTTNPGAAPLWNRNMPSTASYTMYSAPNFDGVSIGSAPVGVSFACLSCHDGTVALDALINGPGSGQFFAGNRATPGASSSLGLLASVGTSDFLDSDASNQMEDTVRSDTGANYETIVGGANPFPNLTQDLSDDHPISFQMPISSADPQFNASKTLDTNPTTNQGIVRITRGYSYDDKRDAIRLYPPSGGTTITSADSGWVECASCHNPHTPRPLFLRLPSPPDVGGTVSSTTAIPATYGGTGEEWGDDPNAGSAVCLTCHEK
jgi:hypothetical protein